MLIMVYPGLMADGASGLDTVPAVRHAEEVYSTDQGPALIHGKHFPPTSSFISNVYSRIVFKGTNTKPVWMIFFQQA